MGVEGNIKSKGNTYHFQVIWWQYKITDHGHSIILTHKDLKWHHRKKATVDRPETAYHSATGVVLLPP